MRTSKGGEVADRRAQAAEIARRRHITKPINPGELPPATTQDSEDFAEELFQTFIESLPSTMADFDSQLAGRQTEALARTVHGLKGSLVALGARTDVVASNTTLLEQRLRTGHDDEVTWTLAERLKEDLLRMRRAEAQDHNPDDDSVGMSS